MCRLQRPSVFQFTKVILQFAKSSQSDGRRKQTNVQKSVFVHKLRPQFELTLKIAWETKGSTLQNYTSAARCPSNLNWNVQHSIVSEVVRYIYLLCTILTKMYL